MWLQNVQIFWDWLCQWKNCRGNSKLNCGVPGQILYHTTTTDTIGTQFIVHNIFRIPALMRLSVIFSSISLRTITSQKSDECAGCCGKVFWKLLVSNLAENNPAWLNGETCKDAKIFTHICIYIINLSRDNISNFYLTKSFDMSPQFSGLAGRPRLRGRATCRDRSCVRACSTPGNSRRNKLKCWN